MSRWLSSDAAHRRYFLTGIGVGVALRIFACAVLVGLLYSPISRPVRALPPLLAKLVPTAYWLAAISSLVWVLLTTGFIGAYFWRHLELKSYIDAIWINTIAFWVLLFGICVYLFGLTSLFGLLPFFSVLLFSLDVGMCSRGAEHGRQFWNSRLGRQFLGDFSEREEE